MTETKTLAKLWRNARSRDPALHMRFLVRVVFLYAIYRIISRPAIQYGLLSSDDAIWPRPYTSFYPTELSKFLGFPALFDYWWPTPEVIAYVQIIGVMSALIGLAGLAPRLMSASLFLSLSFTTWMMQVTNSEIDGGTLVLALTLWFATCNRESLGFRPRGKPFSSSRHCFAGRGPAAASLLGSQVIVGSFYLLSGINKLVDSGIDWPFTLRLDILGQVRQYETVNLTERLGEPLLLTVISSSSYLSIFSGFVVLFAELLFIFSLLLFRRSRWLFVAAISSLHVIVHFSAGINFLGNTLVLLAILDVSRARGNLKKLFSAATKTAT